MTTFVKSATEFNGTVTSGIQTLTNNIQALADQLQALAERQAQTEAALQSLIATIDRFIRGQGPNGHPKA